MQKQITQIRDLEIIEKELISNTAGVLAVLAEEDQVVQHPTNYLYVDKNIYLFFSNEDELYNSIRFDHVASFSILRALENKKFVKSKFIATYQYLAITISGMLRKVDDLKLIEDLKKNYVAKYANKKSQSEIDFTGFERIVIIDTEEIQAVEEIGG